MRDGMWICGAGACVIVNIGGGGRVGSGGGHRRASLKPAPPTEETILTNMLVEKLLSSKLSGLAYMKWLSRLEMRQSR